MKMFQQGRPFFILESFILAQLAVSILAKPPVSGRKTAVVHADGGCSPASLQGTYAVHGQGTFLVPVPGFPAPPFPFGEAGIATFDGTGKLFGKTAVNAGGLLLTPTLTGTYTVRLPPHRGGSFPTTNRGAVCLRTSSPTTPVVSYPKES